MWTVSVRKQTRMGCMSTTHRVLRLLGLLQQRTSWQASELAERLEVTDRTVRRDVLRLREMGYPVESDRGVDGGYRLGAGRGLPPLLLDDDEAVALVASLRMVALSGQDKVGESALRALAKLDPLLPPRLRALASALDQATVALPGGRSSVSADSLAALATAQRDRLLVRFVYTRPDAAPTDREVEPARLMTQGEHWYLQGFDRLRDDWRVFRVDRIEGLQVTTWRCPERTPPSAGFDRSLASRYPCRVGVQMDVDVERFAARVPASYREALEPVDGGCRVRVGASNWDELAWHLLWVMRDLGASMIVEAGDPGAQPLREALARIAEDAARTASSLDVGGRQDADLGKSSQ